MTPRTLCRVVLAAALAALSVVACDLETNPQALVILGNMVPDESCKVRAAGGGQEGFQPFGTLDLSLGTRYVVFLQVENRFEAVGDFEASDGRLDGSAIQVTGLDTKYRLNSRFTNSFQGAIDATEAEELGFPGGVPGSTSSTASVTLDAAGTGVVAAEIIPDRIGQFFRYSPELGAGQPVDLVAEITVVGRRADGDDVKSGVFEYRVTLCNGCLVQDIYDDDVAEDPLVTGGLSAEIIGLQCFAGQDWLVTNAFCGLNWGGQPDTCKYDRCMGRSSTLYCGSDKAALPAP